MQRIISRNTLFSQWIMSQSKNFIILFSRISIQFLMALLCLSHHIGIFQSIKISIPSLFSLSLCHGNETKNEIRLSKFILNHISHSKWNCKQICRWQIVLLFWLKIASIASNMVSVIWFDLFCRTFFFSLCVLFTHSLLKPYTVIF